MRHEFNSRRLFGITRSKGKMYELGLPESLHIAVPPKSEPQELFLLTVGTLGDVAAALSDSANDGASLPSSAIDEVGFSASFFDAFLESRFSESISRDTALLASSAYYLARRPGSSLVLARRIQMDTDSSVERLLHWVLSARWNEYPEDLHPLYGNAIHGVAKLLANHFYDGSGLTELTSAIDSLRHRAYEGGSARDLLFIDIIAAIARLRVKASSWVTLPNFTGIPAKEWATAIRRRDFPKELWPSQILLGQAGLFSGTSGIVQMPTSAGKTRSVEIVLRSGFLSGRTRLAVVVAPFRALCHEISTSLRHAFKDDDVKVNELSDAIQLDFLDEIAEFIGEEATTSQYILALTPEKLLYVLRQTPTLVNDIGIVIYDEGHQFDSGSRGITYELLLTEIKGLLPTGAQTVLVSAVIQNAQAIAQWLMGDDAQVVGGSGLLPTARSVAFASWIERLGQLMFFESDNYDQHDYFVPRVIEQQALTGDGVVFPEKDNSKDISLYLGFRLVSQGAVAIFCGRKDTAANMAARAVEVFEGGLTLPAPATSANQDELRRMKNLLGRHFGDASNLTQAAALGVFVHHGTTPHGVRLSVEYAMQQGKINFVACTSTLAQGVNLPIRYLIVPGIHQAGEKIKVRDFQNLVGRAGRSGMHTEGLVIFSDPNAFDKRRSEYWRFRSSVELLSSDRSESTTSSLLEVLAPFRSSDGKGLLRLPTEGLCSFILFGEDSWLTWANEVVKLNPQFKFKAQSLVTELHRRRKLIYAVESYLMANRGNSTYEDFRAAAERLASATLAHHLASDDVKPTITGLFVSVAEYINQNEPAAEKQALYSKTLLGVKSAKAIERWVRDNREILLSLKSNEDWLAQVWQLFCDLSDDKFFHAVEPKSLPIQLARLWIQGNSYNTLFEVSSAIRGTKPWGSKQRRRLTDEDLIGFCESTLGFDCCLILAAVAQFLFRDANVSDTTAAPLALFQKSLKYGLPDGLSISSYEYGFADRVVAQHLCSDVCAEGFTGHFFAPALRSHPKLIEAVLEQYPSYFESVLAGRVP